MQLATEPTSNAGGGVIVFDDGEEIATFERHAFIRGGPEGSDDIFDKWVAWFESRGVPYLVVTARDNRRRLYKHQTRISNSGLVPCCEKFRPEAEGRDLKHEAFVCCLRDNLCRDE